MRTCCTAVLCVALAVACSDDEKPAPRGTAPEIAAPTLVNGVVGKAFQATFAATGDTPLTWSVTAGTLPPGIALDADTGVYAGTPTIPGSVTFTIAATSSAGTDNLEITHVIDAPPWDAVILLEGNRVQPFSVAYPTGASASFPLAGLAVGYQLVSIDHRPLNGWLYGLGVNSEMGTMGLYAINIDAGLAVLVGSLGQLANSAGTPIALGDAQWEMDGHPLVDRFRVISSAGKNFRYDPNEGAPVDSELGTAATTQPDSAINGAVINAIAYTNNDNTAQAFTLYSLSATSDALYIHNGNAGQQLAPVPLSRQIDSVAGFDIQAGIEVTVTDSAVSSGTGLAIVKLTGETGNALVRIDLVNGNVTTIAPMPDDAVGLAVVSGAPRAFVAIADTNEIWRFDLDDPTPLTHGLGGTCGDIVGIDYRPATGQLMAFGVNAVADAGTLCRLDPVSGAATVVSAAANAVAFVDSGGAAVDFPDPSVVRYSVEIDPRTDRVRVTTANGLNFRINPSTGNPIDGDLGGSAASVAGPNMDAPLGALAPGQTGVWDTAFTNTDSPAIDQVSTMYTLDVTSDRLCLQRPPTSGLQANCVAVTLGGAAVEFTATGGFDIPSETFVDLVDTPVTAGIGYVELTVDGSMGLYLIDLATGALTKLHGLINGTSDLAVGRGLP